MRYLFMQHAHLSRDLLLETSTCGNSVEQTHPLPKIYAYGTLWFFVTFKY
jgi:hypothetical protein